MLKQLSVLICVLMIVGCGSKEKVDKKPQPETDTTNTEFIKSVSFTDLQGDTVSVSDFEGKVVLIDFWETWCKPCISSFPTMQDLQEEYPSKFKILAVTPGFTDTRKDARSFAQDHDYDFKYLMDSNDLNQKLGVQGIPYKVFIDTTGTMIKQTVGTSGPQEDYKKIRQIIKRHTK